MKAFQKPGRLLAFAGVLGLGALAVLSSSASAVAAPTTLTFKELDKGSTVHFVDNAPEATFQHGVVSISPGDMLVTTNPLEIEGKVAGKIRIVCTATAPGSTKNFDSAGLLCTGIAKIPGGTLVLAEKAREEPAEGAVTGGTGTYAGARGTFVSRRGRGGSTNTVTLLE